MIKSTQLIIKITIGILFMGAMAHAQVETYVVYAEGFDNGSPGGVMGANDGKGLRVVGNYDQNPAFGKYCLKIGNDGSEQWNGLYVFASGRWGAQSDNDADFAHLKGYTYFEFYARSDRNVTITVGFGEGQDDAFSDGALALTPKWKKYTYYVGDVDLKSVNGLFFVSLSQACNVYFDNIIFIKGSRKDMKLMKPDMIAERPAYSAPKVPIKVEVKNNNGQYQLMRNGEPYFIKGAGGTGYMDRVKAYGGNSVRTWSDDNAGAILDSAYKHGLTVMLGLWMGHERHGFNYDDKESVAFQTLKFKEAVLKYKDHPALLLWGIGNEMDLFYTNTNVWYAVQDVAKMIHELDPNHPTSTVTAGLDTAETRLIVERCPDVDIYGVNTYGDIGTVRDRFRTTKWNKPYMITEWGPTGHWEIAKTDFGVPMEQTSKEKAAVYRERYGYITGDKEMCIGSYVFLWGYKQETTPTWYGLFLQNGAETEVMDVIEQNWSGKLPENKSPSLNSLLIEGKAAKENIYLRKDKTYTAVADIAEPENETVRYEWSILPESTTTKAGGDYEEKPEPMPQLLLQMDGNKLTFASPEQSGAYRLFVYAYDKHNNAAVANTTFFVRE